MMDSRRFFQHFKNKLIALYPGINEKIFIDFLERYSLYFQCTLRESLQNVKNELLNGRPLEYILKEKFFYNRLFYLDENVLIPRFESEIIVERSLEYITSKNWPKKVKIIDIGTGPGTLGLSIIHELLLPFELTLTDISDEALKIARHNYFLKYDLLNKDGLVFFEKADRLNGLKGEFDLIVSNPPYIKSRKDRDSVHFSTHQFEPHIALYLDDKIYDQWFGDFLKQVSKHLRPEGLFMMEGSEFHLEKIMQCGGLEWASSVKLTKDLLGKNRFIEVIK